MYEVENPMVRDEIKTYSKSFYFNRGHFYISEEEDEPDWDDMPGGHDDDHDDYQDVSL